MSRTASVQSRRRCRQSSLTGVPSNQNKLANEMSKIERLLRSPVTYLTFS